MINVICVIDGVVYSNNLFYTSDKAEEYFRFVCKQDFGSFLNLSEEDQDAVIEDGYYQETNLCWCISHPIIGVDA